MLIRMQQRARLSMLSAALAAIVLVLVPRTGFAQEPQPSVFADAVKSVVLDPTTYAPAAIAYHATMRDWNSSQPFFRNGYRERNQRYTISGRPDDIPLSFADGQQRILKDALLNLQVSAINNATSRVLERTLIGRFPEHRKLVRTVGWVQRIAFAAFLSYRLSEAHYRQAGENERLARQVGLR